MPFENFKFEVLETQAELEEETIKPAERKKQEDSKKEASQITIAAETEGIKKEDTGTSSTPPKRRYSKRKSTSRRGQTRGRGRKPYSPRKTSEGDESKKTAKQKTTSRGLTESDEKKFNTLPDNVEAPIIPLPAPYVRPKTKSDSPDSVPEGNVSDV